MAKAKAVTNITHVELSLSLQEAQTLLDICYRIGGSPVVSRRRHAESIMKALIEDAGLSGRGCDDIEPFAKSIWFKDEVK